MCGIAGFYLNQLSQERDSILRIMNEKLKHRGPDGEGFYTDEHIAFSHRRLAIIDLNQRSNQPFMDEKKDYVITFNGEIYNYLELKKLLIDDGFHFKTTSNPFSRLI